MAGAEFEQQCAAGRGAWFDRAHGGRRARPLSSAATRSGVPTTSTSAKRETMLLPERASIVKPRVYI